MSKKRGLILGKFAPFHQGHQLLMETALSEMDEVITVIYNCPEITNVPLNIRADWIKKIYPNVQVIKAWDGLTEVGDTPEIIEKYFKKKLLMNSLFVKFPFSYCKGNWKPE